jgi:hypothetical protein
LALPSARHVLDEDLLVPGIRQPPTRHFISDIQGTVNT